MIIYDSAVEATDDENGTLWLTVYLASSKLWDFFCLCLWPWRTHLWRCCSSRRWRGWRWRCQRRSRSWCCCPTPGSQDCSSWKYEDDKQIRSKWLALTKCKAPRRASYFGSGNLAWPLSGFPHHLLLEVEVELPSPSEFGLVILNDKNSKLFTCATWACTWQRRGWWGPGWLKIKWRLKSYFTK